MKKDNNLKEPGENFGKHYTYADYLQFSYDEMVEIIKGKIFDMSPAPTSSHQRISRKLCTIIDLTLKNQKCEMFAAPFDVILPLIGKDFMDSDIVVQPDIMVVCNSNKIQELGCFGAPDWIIEVLSPHTIKKDLQDKFDIYEESGVYEYWIVEPENETVEVFVLEKDTYKRINTYVTNDVINCHTLPNLFINLGDVFE